MRPAGQIRFAIILGLLVYSISVLSISHAQDSRFSSDEERQAAIAKAAGQSVGDHAFGPSPQVRNYFTINSVRFRPFILSSDIINKIPLQNFNKKVCEILKAQLDTKGIALYECPELHQDEPEKAPTLRDRIGKDTLELNVLVAATDPAIFKQTVDYPIVTVNVSAERIGIPRPNSRTGNYQIVVPYMGETAAFEADLYAQLSDVIVTISNVLIFK